MKKTIFIFAAALAAFAGCSKSPVPSDKPSSYIIKGEVASMGTKVSATDITADEIGFKWDVGDVVAYITGPEEEPIFVPAVCTDAENGIFEIADPTGLEEGEEYNVMYPFPDENLLPTAMEERREGNIGNKHIITGSGDLSGFCLDGHMPVVHLSLKGSGTVGKIELRPLSDGEYTLEFGTIQTCGTSGVTLGNTPVDFYVSLNSADTEDDITYFNIKIYDTGNNLLLDKNGSANLEEINRVLDMPVIEISRQ